MARGLSAKTHTNKCDDDREDRVHPRQPRQAWLSLELQLRQELRGREG